MNTKTQETFQARDQIALSERLTATVAGVKSGKLESARFDDLAKSDGKRRKLFEAAAEAARATEATLQGFLAIEATEKERKATTDRTIAAARLKATARPAAVSLIAQLNAITDPQERNKFYQANKAEIKAESRKGV